eukprot:1029213-Amphidinium_carterae.1
MADVAANQGTSGHMPLEPSKEWKQWSMTCGSAYGQCFNDHALKNRPCDPLKRKKRAKLQPGFLVDSPYYPCAQ